MAVLGRNPCHRPFWELASEACLYCRDDHNLSFIKPLPKPFSIQTAECGIIERCVAYWVNHILIDLFASLIQYILLCSRLTYQTRKSRKSCNRATPRVTDVVVLGAFVQYVWTYCLDAFFLPAHTCLWFLSRAITSNNVRSVAPKSTRSATQKNLAEDAKSDLPIAN